MAAMTADNEVFLTVALPAEEETRAWRLQCLREAEGVRDVVVEEDRVRCGPFVLGDEAAVPPLLYAFACAAADANEDPVVTFDEAEDCLAFLRAVAQQRPGAAAAAAKTIAAVERSISDSAPLPDEHRAVHETPAFLPGECSKIIEYAEAHGLERGARHAAHATTDVSCFDVPQLRWVVPCCRQRIVARLAEAFGGENIAEDPNSSFKVRASWGDGTADFVLCDLFVARYSADGQRALEEHEDGSPWAFVVPLNDGFEGGGTQFVELEGAPIFRPAVGRALLFSGKNRHRGVATTKGVRYILAGFVDVREPSRSGEYLPTQSSSPQLPTQPSFPQSRKRARGAAASPESSSEVVGPRNQRAAAFDACARAARPVLQQLAAMSDDRARLAQALLDATQE